MNARTETEEFVTIIARTTDEAMQQYKARGLDSQGFAIAGRIGRHKFTLVNGPYADDLFPASRWSQRRSRGGFRLDAKSDAGRLLTPTPAPSPKKGEADPHTDVEVVVSLPC